MSEQAHDDYLRMLARGDLWPRSLAWRIPIILPDLDIPEWMIYPDEEGPSEEQIERWVRMAKGE